MENLLEIDFDPVLIERDQRNKNEKYKLDYTFGESDEASETNYNNYNIIINYIYLTRHLICQ